MVLEFTLMYWTIVLGVIGMLAAGFIGAMLKLIHG
jgi:hypothetical protein